MIRAFDGKTPKIAASAFISEWAYVIGDVEIGEDSGVWPGVVIRADFGSIKIGRNCHIEDNSVVHAGADMTIGDDVMIGHGVIVHGRSIGSDVLVGNNATILDNAEIGDHCLIGASSLVSGGQKIPDNSLVMGVPAEIRRQLSSRELAMMRSGRQSYADLLKRYRGQRLSSPPPEPV